MEDMVVSVNPIDNGEPGIAQLGHVTLSTPDIEKSLWFYRDLLGMEEVARDGDKTYLRAYQEHEHHSIVLQDSNKSELVHTAFRTRRPEDVEIYARRLHDQGIEVVEAPAGTKKGQGDAIRFFAPHSGQPTELFYDIEKPLAPEALRSNLISNTSKRRGLGVRRIDHVNLHCAGENVGPAEAWLQQNLGFKRREALVVPGGPTIATWNSVTPQVHDVALVGHWNNENAQLHHVALNLENFSDSLTAADILAENDIQIDLGPAKHGVGQAMYLYVRDPGSGHRIELYSGGYMIFAPDWEPVNWTPEQFGSALTWYGEPFPAQDFSHKMTATTSAVSKLI